MYYLTNCLDTLFIYFEEKKQKKKHAHEQISIQQNVLETKA